MQQADVSPLFEALADPTRRRVVQLLAAGPRPAGDLARAVGTSPPSMSRHLRVLLQSGMVSDERRPDDARLRVFRLEPESVTAMRLWLERLQDEWDDQLQAFKGHIAARSRT